MNGWAALGCDVVRRVDVYPGLPDSILRPAIDPVFPSAWAADLPFLARVHSLSPLPSRTLQPGHAASRHRDAEILSRIAQQMGFEFVRGSSKRGGVTAMRELLRKSRQMNLAITPDGPRGPRRRHGPGPIFLASKLGLPIVLMGFGYDRPWRVKGAWDKFAIPRPYSPGLW